MEMATNKTPLTLKKKVWLEMALTFGVRVRGVGGAPAWLWGGVCGRGGGRKGAQTTGDCSDSQRTPCCPLNLP